ncbi:MAG: hypothetical protein DI551_08705 [Micavibrio aeruginosavorus]|uniref:Uncharacterized protein n=1 Tax=Micavibrio aeruginosavorus TaxID=349221 RepID=A0A2W5MW51_9BACT|nr:MAG: hypothetical protein DI551_08705 [Micavibrio aeruginosavorus]
MGKISKLHRAVASYDKAAPVAEQEFAKRATRKDVLKFRKARRIILDQLDKARESGDIDGYKEKRLTGIPRLLISRRIYIQGANAAQRYAATTEKRDHDFYIELAMNNEIDPEFEIKIDGARGSGNIDILRNFIGHRTQPPTNWFKYRERKTTTDLSVNDVKAFIDTLPEAMAYARKVFEARAAAVSQPQSPKF